jgi:uncharacterized protein (DUF1330 family)
LQRRSEAAPGRNNVIISLRPEFAMKSKSDPSREGSRYILVVSLWLRDHDIAAFESFEKRASKLLARHGGTIDLAIRPLKADSNPNTPFEIHIVSFADQRGYAEYRSDPAMQELAAEREKIISRTSVLEGHDASQYLRFPLFPEAK